MDLIVIEGAIDSIIFVSQILDINFDAHQQPLAGAFLVIVHAYPDGEFLFAQDDRFPLRVESFGADGSPIETVDMTEVETGVAFPEHFFTP